MGSFLDKKSTYKNPAWMKNKTFPKGKGGGFGSQLMMILLAAILGLILYY